MVNNLDLFFINVLEILKHTNWGGGGGAELMEEGEIVFVMDKVGVQMFLNIFFKS